MSNQYLIEKTIKACTVYIPAPGITKDDVVITTNTKVNVISVTSSTPKDVSKFLKDSFEFNSKLEIQVPEDYTVEKIAVAIENGIITIVCNIADHITEITVK